MIGNSYAEIDMKEAACKVDPEEMLQNARNRIELCQRAEELLLELDKMPLRVEFGRGDTDHMTYALGSIRSNFLRAVENEARWLEEIDK